jgi:TRAP transporter TAXI family solute receptor
MYGVSIKTMKSTKRISLFSILSILSITALCWIRPAELIAETHFVTIGSGDITGVYYPTGLIIAKMVNAKRQNYGVRAAVESTAGSVFNVNALVAGYLEFGLLQSDKQFQAVRGLAEWSQKGPRANLRAVFSLHHETVNLVAAVDADIETLADLKAKRVNLGHPRAGQYQNAIDVLESAGLDPQGDILAEKTKTADAPLMLQENRIDAFFYTAGHPSEILAQAVSGARKVRFVPLNGPGIDKLLDGAKYYMKTTVPVERFYRAAENTVNVETLGVVATLCTAARVPDYVVYVITKEVVDNLEYFKEQHPAFDGLTRQGMLDGLSAPLHPGALKYYRENGLMPY